MLIPRVRYFKNEANVSDFVSGQTKHSKKPVASFVTSFRFRLRFIGYPFVLKQVENEEKMSCMFLLIFHGQTKSETFASFLKNLTLAKIDWCHANFWAVNSKVLGFVDPFPPWSSMVYWMHQKILPSKVKQCWGQSVLGWQTIGHPSPSLTLGAKPAMVGSKLAMKG